MRYESSNGDLSSPPSGEISDPGSPSRRAKRDGEEMVVSEEYHQQQKERRAERKRKEAPEIPPEFERYETVSKEGAALKRYGLLDGKWVQLTAAGLPRKKPGRKPGTVIKPRQSIGEDESTDQHAAKVRKPRKPRDPNAPPGSRKRKLVSLNGEEEVPSSPSPAVTSATTHSHQHPIRDPSSNSNHQHYQFSPTTAPNSGTSSPALTYHKPMTEHQQPSMPPKRENGYPSSMQSILNADPPSYPSPSKNTNPPAVRTSGQSYDPVRGNYDPVRETMVPHKPYSTSGSPRGPAHVSANRSPSIASLIEPSVPRSPNHSQNTYAPTTTSRLHQLDSARTPTSPPRHDSMRPNSSAPLVQGKLLPEAKPETVKTSAPIAAPTPAPLPTPAPAPAPAATPAPIIRPIIKESNFTTIANGPIKKVVEKQKAGTNVSTPKTDPADDYSGEGEGRSILDFGKARPGEEMQAPTIVLRIPLSVGETNKYVNFSRLAEERYGWDALHPRLAANRDRKARIAAAAATLEKAESSRESGDDMSVDLSDAENSNADNGVASGVDAQAKPKKKRNFKEDQYDVDDEFVDDSDMLWEAQAAASRDGFFVYSGPLVPEEEKPPAG